MTESRAIEIIEYTKTFNEFKRTAHNIAFDMAIQALEKTSDKNCSRCINKGKCAIHDNFNIDYCSDWSDEQEAALKGNQNEPRV